MDYALHSSGEFDKDLIADQGALTTEQKTADAKYAAMDFMQKIAYWFQMAMPYALFLGGAVVAYKVYDTESKKKLK